MANENIKKSEILDAALALFMRKGIKGTTTREIALRAGVAEGTLYRHFDSKDELARFIFEQNIDFFWKYLKVCLKNTRTPEEMLKAFVRGYFTFSRREQKRYSFLAAAHQTELKKHSRERMKPMKMLMKIIRIGQRQGRFREMDPSVASAMIMGTIMQTVFYLKTGRIPVKYDAVTKEVTESCLRLVQK